jgi:N utilization substance protein A
LENEVPEIYQGLVEIRSIAREAGYRSKVAVAALKPGVDPVGACVGIRGVRIQAIVRELSDEKIDVIEWNPNTEEFIAKALSPARVLSVFLNKETDGMPTATVVVPEDQLSLAIGRNGQNARLAAKLSGWRIDIKGLFEATSDTLFKIQNDPNYVQYQELESATIPRIETILGKKEEGRPITPEEYRELHFFNNRVESGLIQERQEITKQQQARIQAAKEAVPDDAYDLPLMTLGLPTKVENLLTEAQFANVGELAYRLLLVPNSILDIDGIGPSYLTQIENALEVMIGYKPLPEEYDIVEELVIEETEGEPVSEEEDEGEEDEPVSEEEVEGEEDEPVSEEEVEGEEDEPVSEEEVEGEEDEPVSEDEVEEPESGEEPEVPSAEGDDETEMVDDSETEDALESDEEVELEPEEDQQPEMDDVEADKVDDETISELDDAGETDEDGVEDPQGDSEVDESETEVTEEEAQEEEDISTDLEPEDLEEEEEAESDLIDQED